MTEYKPSDHNALGKWLDQHNARTEYENERLGRNLSMRCCDKHDLLWQLSLVAQKLLKPFRKAHEAIARWQHGRRIALRRRLNGKW